MSWPRLCVFLIMLDSWFFLFSSGFLIFGIGLESHKEACDASILMCILFYGSSKVFIYCFLVEKVHVVWSPTAETGGRMKSRIWKICMALNAGYIVVVVLMCLGLIHYYRSDGACIIGIAPFSSIPLMSFDLFITIFLNVLFLYPLLSSKISNPKIRAVAIRTIAASLVALVTSTVILNALTIFFVTRTSDSHSTTIDTHTSEHEHTHTNNNSFRVMGSKNRSAKSKSAFGEAHALQVMVTTATRTSLDRDAESELAELEKEKGLELAKTP
ncbi:hypothetical protein V5O48_009126 [Marasmius crinis-equi]|uniref:Transmembrane protein n=1 Tax=Marasmius crinis-equi TaxID=585013 RepID=A0ABR3FC52_9AGAR